MEVKKIKRRDEASICGKSAANCLKILIHVKRSKQESSSKKMKMGVQLCRCHILCFRLQEGLHISVIFLRTCSRLLVTRCGWGMVLQRLPHPCETVRSASACNNRNFANGAGMACVLRCHNNLKPQSHTKTNKRKWGMGGKLKPRKDGLVTEVKRLEEASCDTKHN